MNNPTQLIQDRLLIGVGALLLTGLPAWAILDNQADTHATVSPMGTQLPSHDLWSGGTGPSTPNSYGVAGNPNRDGVQWMPPLNGETGPLATRASDNGQDRKKSDRPPQVEVYEYPTYTQ
jgi:hypothetical protein